MAAQRSPCVLLVAVAYNLQCSQLCSLTHEPCPSLCAGLPTGCLQGSSLPWMVSQLRNNNVSLWQPELKLVWVGKECSWFLSNLPALAITQFWMCSLLLLWAFDTWMWNLLLTWLSLASVMDIKKVCSVLISTNVLGSTSLIGRLCQCLSAPAGLQEQVRDLTHPLICP